LLLRGREFERVTPKKKQEGNTTVKEKKKQARSGRELRKKVLGSSGKRWKTAKREGRLGKTIVPSR